MVLPLNKTSARTLLLCITLPLALGTCTPRACASERLNYITGTLDEVLDYAEQAKMCVFVHTTSPANNCCDGMIRPIIADERLVRYFNDNFISYQLNTDQIDYYNFVHIHELDEEPVFFFFSPYGGMVEKVRGVSKPNQLLSIAKLVLANNLPTYMDPHKLQGLIDTYNNGLRSGEMLYHLAYGLKGHGMPCNQVVNDYLGQLGPNAMQYDSVKQFVFDFAENVENRAIDLLLNNINDFYDVLRKSHVNDRLTLALHNSIRTAIDERDQRIYEKAIEVIKRYGHVCPNTCAYFLKAEYYEGIKDWDNLAKITADYINTLPQPDAFLLNSSAFKMYYYQQNKKYLKLGLKWAEQAREIDDSYACNLTLALLLKKLERYEDAISVTSRALKIGKEEGADTEMAEDLWDTLKSRGY